MPTISLSVGQTIPLLLSSIALEELALAHIMNAEAEKLQFVLGTLSETGVTLSPAEVSIADLLIVNSSVQRTLRDVIKKEMLLEFKFENILDLIHSTDPPLATPLPPANPPLTTPPPPACTPAVGAAFSNLEAIVNIEGTLTIPYPSEIFISGLEGLISKVTVTINNFYDPGAMNTPNPGHLSLLVVSPSGTAVLIYSEAGDSTGVFGPVTFTIDDNAATLIPQSDFGPGTYQSSVYKNDFSLPAPAPTGAPYPTTLSSLIGQDPNGTWSLYSFDQYGGHGMAISGGWTLTIDTVCS